MKRVFDFLALFDNKSYEDRDIKYLLTRGVKLTCERFSNVLFMRSYNISYYVKYSKQPILAQFLIRNKPGRVRDVWAADSTTLEAFPVEIQQDFELAVIEVKWSETFCAFLRYVNEG